MMTSFDLAQSTSYQVIMQRFGNGNDEACSGEFIYFLLATQHSLNILFLNIRINGNSANQYQKMTLLLVMEILHQPLMLLDFK
jgi:hypothetical protein